MLIIFKLLFYISLVRGIAASAELSERPLFMAVLYGLGSFVLDSYLLVLGASWWGLILKTFVGFLVVWLVFWLLSKLEDAGGLWWLVVILGIPTILL